MEVQLDAVDYADAMPFVRRASESHDVDTARADLPLGVLLMGHSVWVSEAPVERLPEWRRTVPVGVRFRTREGANAVVTTIDVWSDRIALLFAFDVVDASGDPPGRPRHSEPPEPPRLYAIGFSVEDDVATKYQCFGYGGGGTNDFQHGIQFFRPSIPSEARRLLISGPDLSVPIDVPL